jgi:hypothetical protein
MSEEQIKFEHDENGLVKGFNYQYTPEGKIDWFAAIPEKFLYIQQNDPKKVVEIEDKYGKSVKSLKPSEVDKRYLCVLLDGIRYLAALRGFKADIRDVNNVTYDNRYELVASCTITSKITWIANSETNWEITSSDQGGASFGNVESFMKKYVETAASNRAFIRNVRGFLNIGVVGKDEIGPSGNVEKISEEAEPSSSALNPQALLEGAVKKLGLDFKKFKKRSSEYFKEGLKIEDPSTWESFSNISAQDSYSLLGKVTAALQDK